jgi:catechol 2,3-dioxygenase-like lactoylglutathione lyase family enzyme
MLNIESVNHVGIRIGNKGRSVSFYESLGFQFETDAGFEQGHPVIMKHPSGVVLNLLGPTNMPDKYNILMDSEDKYSGITHVALTVSSLKSAEELMNDKGIPITESFSFGGMSAIFIRDPDRNVIELDAYTEESADDMSGYVNHP